MDLILWRHAEAEDGVPDGERALTKKGHKQAAAMAAWLSERLPKRARILVSPATRAQQTAAALEHPFTTSREVGVGASATDVVEAAGWPDAGGTVVIVGHQPTLGRVAALLATGDEADWAIKKGALWWFTHRVRDGDGQVVLRAVIGPDLV
jgi:phosphohistidine phosphatase